MPQILFSLAAWLHAVATVIFVGHHLLLALIYLPVLAKEDAGRVILSAISKRSRAWMYTSLMALALTGTYLTFMDPNYLGIGDFGNPWAILMLIKHLLIVGMIVMGFWFNAILRVGPMMSSNSGAEQTILRFGLYSRWMSICGVIVLFLTVLAQLE